MGLAARGARDLDAGQEPIEDEALAFQLRRQGQRIQLLGLIAAALLTAGVLALSR